MVPRRTSSFVMWAGDAKGRESKKSNTVTVTLPVDTTPPAAPVVSVTGTTSSTVSLAWGRSQTTTTPAARTGSSRTAPGQHAVDG